MLLPLSQRSDSSDFVFFCVSLSVSFGIQLTWAGILALPLAAL